LWVHNCVSYVCLSESSVLFSVGVSSSRFFSHVHSLSEYSCMVSNSFLSLTQPQHTEKDTKKTNLKMEGKQLVGRRKKNKLMDERERKRE